MSSYTNSKIYSLVGISFQRPFGSCRSGHVDPEVDTTGPESLDKNRSGHEPSESIPETTTVGPVSPHETEEIEDGNEES